MIKKKVLFIVNPISGGTKKDTAVNAIKTCMDSSRYDWEIAYTAGVGDAASFASKAVADGYDIVGAVGGDGTISEVASQLVHSDTALGIIPCGSGNGLARHLHIPLE